MASKTTAEDSTVKIFSLLPTYSSAVILPPASGTSSSLLTIRTTLSQRDYVQKTKRQIARQLVVGLSDQSEGHAVAVSSLPIDLGSLVRETVSPSGERVVVLRVTEEKEKGKKKLVEIWQKGTLKLVLDVSDNHGDFYTDGYIGSLQWSKDETHVVYIAERKLSEEDSSQKFKFVPDYGEKLDNKKDPAIVLVNIKDKKAEVLNPFDQILPGQVLFGPADKSLILMGHLREPRRYGIVYCNNRLTGIYQCQLDGSNLSQLSDGTKHARSARLNPSGDLLVFLQNPVGGPHHGCSELVGYDFKTGTQRVIVPIVRIPKTDSPIGFPGLYTDQLPWNTFSTINGLEYLFVDTPWRSTSQVLAIDLKEGNIEHVKSTNASSIGLPNYRLLAVRGKYVVISRGSPSKPQELYLCIITGNTEDAKFNCELNLIDKPDTDEVASILDNIDWSIFQPFPENTNLEVIHLKPKDLKDQKLPLVVIPHGGPHGVSIAEFTVTTTNFVSMGFSIAIVNYTGSIGFGQDSVESLIGKIGELEVEEVQSVAKYLIERGDVDPNKIAVVGGSHGGFIAGHLIGKYPDFYKACVMRNPVLNIGAMVTVTDIPDWCYSELGIPFSFNQFPITDPTTYTQMYTRSPVANIDHVKTPTLLTLGEVDRRVPNSDGLTWWYHLHSKGNVEIHCRMYSKTGHALDSIDAELDGLNEIAKFLSEKFGD